MFKLTDVCLALVSP